MITAGFDNKSGVVLKALGAIALGVAMIFLNQKGIDPFAVMVKAVAVFVLVSGLSTLVYALVKEQVGDKKLLLAGAAFTIVLGAMIFVFAAPITSVFFFFIAAILFLFGMWEIIVLLSLGKFGKTGWLYVFPVLSIILSLILFAPSAQKVYICSAALIMFGVSEIVSAWRVNSAASMRDQMAREAGENVSADDLQGAQDVEAVKVEVVEEDNSVDEQ